MVQGHSVALAGRRHFGEHPSMQEAHEIAAAAAVLGDPTRVAMLMALMDGRALTATELAVAGEVSASTASTHLARMTDAGWLIMVKQGRHRHFRLAGPAFADIIENLQTANAIHRPSTIHTGPHDQALRHARTCYDHLAGTRGVQLLEAMCRRGLMGDCDGTLTLTMDGASWCSGLGIDLSLLRSARRPLCRPCLDWSERRMHLAGALGAALLERLIALGHLRRHLEGRTLDVTRSGERFLQNLGRY